MTAASSGPSEPTLVDNKTFGDVIKIIFEGLDGMKMTSFARLTAATWMALLKAQMRGDIVLAQDFAPTMGEVRTALGKLYGSGDIQPHDDIIPDILAARTADLALAARTNR